MKEWTKTWKLPCYLRFSWDYNKDPVLQSRLATGKCSSHEDKASTGHGECFSSLAPHKTLQIINNSPCNLYRSAYKLYTPSIPLNTKTYSCGELIQAESSMEPLVPGVNQFVPHGLGMRVYDLGSRV